MRTSYYGPGDPILIPLTMDLWVPSSYPCPVYLSVAVQVFICWFVLSSHHWNDWMEGCHVLDSRTQSSGIKVLFFCSFSAFYIRKHLEDEKLWFVHEYLLYVYGLIIILKLCSWTQLGLVLLYTAWKFEWCHTYAINMNISCAFIYLSNC